MPNATEHLFLACLTCGCEVELFALLRLGADLALVDAGVRGPCRVYAQSPPE